MATMTTRDAPLSTTDSTLPLTLFDAADAETQTILALNDVRNAELLDEKTTHISGVRPIARRRDSGSELEISSIDSLSLTDSPTVSSASYRSSKSSLSGIIFKSPGSHRSDKSGSPGNHENKRGSFSLTEVGTLFSEGRWAKSEYSLLKNQYAKFSGKHNAGKANYLRLTLIPFLRNKQPTVLPPSSELELPRRIFSMWWRKLLEVAEGNFKDVNGVDRDLFYEAISALIGLPEWYDHQTKPMYQNLLMKTTVHVLIRAGSTGSLTAAHAGFTGKILAYAFFYLPEFAVYLLSLLRINKAAIRRLLSSVNFGQAQLPLHLVPEHLRSLVQAADFAEPNRSQTAIAWLPIQQCNGWERHFKVDSPLFASFFKHFCTLQTQFLPIDDQLESSSSSDSDAPNANISLKDAVEHGETTLLSCPGMILILACIITRFDGIVADSMRTLGPRNANPYSFRQCFGGKATSKGLANSPMSPERVRIDQLRIFGVFREILHADESTLSYFPLYSKVFDRVLKAVALGTHLHDMDGCVTVCDLAEEWINSIFAVRATKSKYFVLSYKHLAVDWKFWISVVQRMLESDNCHTEIRGLSILFNIWPYIPNMSPENFNRNDQGILQTITKWVLSPEVWTQFFFHWSPLVRSYYHRLLCYRLASVGVGTDSWFVDVESAQDLLESRQLLKDMLAYTFNWCKFLSLKTKLNPECSPSLPMPHLRVGIARFGPLPHLQASIMENSVTRVFPYDIFDTAAYWQTDDTQIAKTFSYDEELLPAKKRTQLGRSTSKASRVSTDTVASTKSNASVSSNISLLSFNNVKSQAKMLGMKLTSKGQSNEEEKPEDITTNAENYSPSEAKASPNGHKEQQDISEGSPKSRTNGLKKRWTLWQKAIPSMRSLPKEEEEARDGNTAPTRFLQTAPEMKEDNAGTTEKKSISGAPTVLQRPAQLKHPRPEIVRPPHRFVLVPTGARPTSRSHLRAPKLPFTPETYIDGSGSNIKQRDAEKDLAAWNYGGRSLAEWNIEVSDFEQFAEQQRDLANETMEMFSMPFLVAEIPWRTAG